MRSWRLLLAAAAAAFIVLFFALDLQRFATLGTLKQWLRAVAGYSDRHPLAAGGIFFTVYVLYAGLSVPGAIVLTVAAGALFGLLWGTVLASFASAIGATLAFLSARFLLRDFVRRHFRGRLEVIDAGVARDGAFYLFTLRLIHVFPYILINLGMGLTALPVRTFYWVTQAGMLAATLVYANAGTQLARIDSLADVLSVQMLGAFALLGVLPLLARWVLRLARRW